MFGASSSYLFLVVLQLVARCKTRSVDQLDQTLMRYVYARVIRRNTFLQKGF